MRLLFLLSLIVPFFSIAQEPIEEASKEAKEVAEEQILQQVYQDMGAMGTHDQLPFNFLNSHQKRTVFQKGGYVYEDFQPTVVIDRKGKSYTAVGNYYILSDEIQIYEAEKKEILSIRKSDVMLVKIGDKDFVPKAYYDRDGQIRVGFLELLALGDRSLYRRYYQREQNKASHPLYGNKMARETKMVTSEELYQSKDRQAAQKMKKGKRHVLKALSGRKKAIAQFAKENRLGARKTEDIILLFKKYNRMAEKAEARKKAKEQKGK